MHEQYDTTNQKNDIAILALSGSTAGSKSIWPICLPPPGQTFVGEMATVIGKAAQSLYSSFKAIYS